MAAFSGWVIPAVMCGILGYGLLRRVDVFDSFVEGAREGLGVSLRILPSLVALMTAVGMFKASGALDVLTQALSPVAHLLLLPPQVLPLAILRPISGSGSLAVFQELLKVYGPDGLIGRVASVLQGSTETTFYTIAVYFGAVGVRRTGRTLPAALAGDVAGFVMSALLVRVFFAGL